ncbi:hypothetical protein M0P25_03555 [archaeon]|jgi:hypothetical protein|nr:hypothetical protein [archaeon]
MEYKLKIDGDSIEKESWDLFIQAKFPNYETFWQNFVVPRTNRPDNFYLRQEILFKENEVFITQIHYSILVQFYYINKYIVHCEDDFVFENLITRLSSITDLTEEFLFRYLIYLRKIDVIKLVKSADNSKLKISVKDAVKSLEDGINYSISVFNKKKILIKVFKKESVKELFKLVDEIRSYRNKVIHSWAIFKINNKVPSKEFLINLKFKKYHIWSYLYYLLNYNFRTPEAKDVIENFKDKSELIIGYHDELLIKINLVWKDLLEIK